MSCATSLFAVDLDEIRRTVAERDMSVVRRAQAAHPDEFDHMLGDGLPLGEALRRIVGGEVEGYSPQYGYALRLLCRVEGELLPDDDLIGDLEPLKLQSPLEQYRIPINVPANKDFPFISFLEATEVERESKRLAGLDLSYPSDPGVEEAREAYAACIREAAERGKAVVSFYS